MWANKQNKKPSKYYTKTGINGYYYFDEQYSDGCMWLAVSHLVSLLSIISWVFFLTIGVFLYQDYYKIIEGSVKLPLKWFDSLLKQTGSILPLIIWLWRYTLKKTQKQIIYGHGILESLIIILLMAFTRLILYLLHVQGEKYHVYQYIFGDNQIMSDHVFLGSSLVASYTLEIWYQIVDILSIQNQGTKKSRRWAFFSLFGLLIFSCLLFFLTCGDMFYTAKYFHSPFHTVVAAFLGIIFFQLPVVVWILQDGNSLQFYPVK